MRCLHGICDGSGWVVDEEARSVRPCRCKAEQDARRSAARLSGRIPERFRDASFDHHPVATMPRTVLRPVRRYLDALDENLADGRGLWFSGPTGTGKTTLGMLVARTAIERGRSVAVYALPRLLGVIRNTFDDRPGPSTLELLDGLATVDLLHVDDVGAENSSPWVLEQLYSIVNARYEARRAVTLTTNLGAADLAEQITARTVSRLVEMCEVVTVGGEDLRYPESELDDFIAEGTGAEPRGAPPTFGTGTGAAAPRRPRREVVEDDWS